MTNWLENLCSQMDLADQPCGPITSIFSEAKQKPRNAQRQGTPKILYSLSEEPMQITMKYYIPFPLYIV